jgi:predicted N-acetyltransferase YhbS
MIIRPGTDRDLDRLQDIERECFGPELRWSREDMLHELDLGRVLVAMDDEVRLVGYAAIKVRESGQGILNSVAVARIARGQGLGHLLVNRALGHLVEMGATHCELDCNVDLVPFYAQHGFTVCGFYTTGLAREPRVSMTTPPFADASVHGDGCTCVTFPSSPTRFSSRAGPGAPVETRESKERREWGITREATWGTLPASIQRRYE